MYFFLVMNHVCCYIKVLFEFQLLLIFIYVQAYVLYKLILCQTCTVEKNVENVSMWDYKLINSYLLKCFNDIHSKSHMIFKILFIRVLINLFLYVFIVLKVTILEILEEFLSCTLQPKQILVKYFQLLLDCCKQNYSVIFFQYFYHNVYIYTDSLKICC